MIGISLAGARRHPAGLDGRAGLLRAHAAGHQRVRRRDAGPAHEPAADLRRRHGARAAARRTSPGYVHLDGFLAQLQTVAAGAVPLRRGRRACPRPSCGSGRSRASSPRRCRRCRGRWAGAAALLLFVALLAGLAVRGQPAARRHARRRSRIVMLSLVLLTGYGGHVSLAQLTFAGVGALTYAKLDEPNLYGLLRLGAGRRRGRCARGAAGAAADRPLPRAGHARLRLDHGQAGLPGRLGLRLQRRCCRPAGSRSLGHAVRSTGGYVFVMAVFLVLIALGACCCCAAASSAGCSSRCATARPPAGPSASTCAGSGSGCSRSRPGWPDSAVRCTPGCGRTSAPATSSTSTACCCCCSRWSAGVTSVTGAVLGGIGLMVLPGAAVELPVGGRDVLRGHRRLSPSCWPRSRTASPATCSGSAGGAQRPDRTEHPGQPAEPARLREAGTTARPRESEGVPAHAH